MVKATDTHTHSLPSGREMVIPKGSECPFCLPVKPVVRIIPERFEDDRPGCSCYSYAEGGPHDPSCALEA